MLILEYGLSKKPTKDIIRACNKGARSMQDLLVESAKVIDPKIVWLIWLLTRVYFRKVTDKSIFYSFPLFISKSKVERKIK